MKKTFNFILHLIIIAMFTVIIPALIANGLFVMFTQLSDTMVVIICGVSTSILSTYAFNMLIK